MIVFNWLFRPDDSETLILELLRLKAMNGLELRDETGLGFHKIYPALNRLEQQGKIGFHWVMEPRPEQGYARRKYYYLKP